MIQGKMIQKKYLHIGFNFSGIPLVKELEPIFSNMSEDWLRYTGNCWIVWTQHSSAEWLTALQPKLGINDQMLILELTMGQDLNSWLPQWIWDWLYKKRA